MLGAGAFGTVVHVIDRDSFEEIAVKVIDKRKVSRNDIGGLRKEAEILSGLNHEHIVEFKHIKETDTRIFLGMELVQGGQLKQLIEERQKKGQQFSDEEASCILRGLLSALKYLHQKDVVHRDLKPENILLANRNDLSSVKVADFGLSARYDRESYSRNLNGQCGTMIFMAPELIENRNYSMPVDIWSVGMIMFILCHGKHPLYKKSDKAEQFKEKMAKREFQPGVNFSEMAANLFERFTRENPLERYTAEQAFVHPWITRKIDAEIPLTVEESLNKYLIELNLKKKMGALYFINLMSKKLLKQHITPDYNAKLDTTSKSAKAHYTRQLEYKRSMQQKEMILFADELSKTSQSWMTMNDSTSTEANSNSSEQNSPQEFTSTGRKPPLHIDRKLPKLKSSLSRNSSSSPKKIHRMVACYTKTNGRMKEPQRFTLRKTQSDEGSHDYSSPLLKRRASVKKTHNSSILGELPALKKNKSLIDTANEKPDRRSQTFYGFNPKNPPRREQKRTSLQTRGSSSRSPRKPMDYGTGSSDARNSLGRMYAGNTRSFLVGNTNKSFNIKLNPTRT